MCMPPRLMQSLCSVPFTYPLHRHDKQGRRSEWEPGNHNATRHMQTDSTASLSVKTPITGIRFFNSRKHVQLAVRVCCLSSAPVYVYTPVTPRFPQTLRKSTLGLSFRWSCPCCGS
jgi:hypothetical protein